LWEFDHVERRVRDVLSVQTDASHGADVVDQVVHAIETPQEGRLAAARRADEGGHAPRLDGDGQRVGVDLRTLETLEERLFDERVKANSIYVSDMVFTVWARKPDLSNKE